MIYTYFAVASRLGYALIDADAVRKLEEAGIVRYDRCERNGVHFTLIFTVIP